MPQVVYVLPEGPAPRWRRYPLFGRRQRPTLGDPYAGGAGVEVELADPLEGPPPSVLVLVRREKSAVGGSCEVNVVAYDTETGRKLVARRFPLSDHLGTTLASWDCSGQARLLLPSAHDPSRPVHLVFFDERAVEIGRGAPFRLAGARAGEGPFADDRTIADRIGDGLSGGLSDALGALRGDLLLLGGAALLLLISRR